MQPLDSKQEKGFTSHKIFTINHELPLQNRTVDTWEEMAPKTVFNHSTLPPSSPALCNFLPS